jgi:hypothetical protein
MNNRLAYLYILLVFLIVGFYLFSQGEKFGVEKYKHSINMQMALEAAYKYGYWDCKDGKKADWNNDGEECK